MNLNISNEEPAGQNPQCGHLELRGGIQPALVLAQLLPVLRFPDDFVDGLQDPSAAGLGALQQGEVWCAACGTNRLNLAGFSSFILHFPSHSLISYPLCV